MLELLIALIMLIAQVFGVGIAAELEGRIGVLEDRIAALEARSVAAQPSEQRLAVISTHTEDGGYVDPDVFDMCIVYATVAGPQTKCAAGAVGTLEQFPAGTAALLQANMTCWHEARIGEPLPDCWR